MKTAVAEDSQPQLTSHREMPAPTTDLPWQICAPFVLRLSREFIQEKLKTKMNSAVYLAALLNDEGYADPARRGYVKFHQKSDAHTS
jgi:hypothetical protein